MPNHAPTTQRAATAPETTALSRLSDDELSLIVTRTWGQNRASDRTLLDYLAQRLGQGPLPIVAVLVMAALYETDARQAAREKAS